MIGSFCLYSRKKGCQNKQRFSIIVSVHGMNIFKKKKIISIISVIPAISFFVLDDIVCLILNDIIIFFSNKKEQNDAR